MYDTIRPTKRGQGRYASDLRVAPKGYEGSYNCVANILILIVLYVFDHTVYWKRTNSPLASRSESFLVFYSVYSNCDVISWVPLHVKREIIQKC